MWKDVDGAAFALSAAIAFGVYLLTLAPEVTFGYPGVNATAALYPGVGSPSGHPLWAVFGWVVIKVFPFSNVAWRLAVGCAVAGAMACGFVAATVSRMGGEVFQGEDRAGCRIVCGAVAGLGLAFEGGLWSKAVVVDTWPLTMLLFCSTLFCLCRWFVAPEPKRWLLVASFLHGVSLSESQALAPVTFALPIFLAFGNLRLGRDLFLFWEDVSARSCA